MKKRDSDFQFLNFSMGPTSVSASRKSRSENAVNHNEMGLLFRHSARKVASFHWETKGFQSAILTFHFVDFSNGKTWFSASRESRSENVVNRNEMELLFRHPAQKSIPFFIGKQKVSRV